MYIGVISMRYAKALLAYADEKGTEDTVYEEAGILADSFSRIPELRQALDNPVLPTNVFREFPALVSSLHVNPNYNIVKEYQRVFLWTSTTNGMRWRKDMENGASPRLHM